jgi:hypothetical protein
VWGELVTAAMLTPFVLESVSIAVDQWFASRADPASLASSIAMVPVFVVVAAVAAVPVGLFLRHLDRTGVTVRAAGTHLGPATRTAWIATMKAVFDAADGTSGPTREWRRVVV